MGDIVSTALHFSTKKYGITFGCLVFEKKMRKQVRAMYCLIAFDAEHDLITFI